MKDSNQIAVWSLHGGSFARELEEAGIRLEIGCPGHGNRVFALRSAWRLATEVMPEIVHSWGWISSAVMGGVAARIGAVHVTSLVRMGTLPRRKRSRLLLAARLGRLCMGNSLAGLAAWRIPESKARLVPNAFEPGRIGGLSATPGSHDPFAVVMAGSMSDHKDFRTLIRAAAILRDRRPSGFVFHLIGDGPDRAGLEAMASASGCSGTVVFHGQVDDAVPRLLMADAGVLLSPMGEGMSNFLMECMAVGLPVLCTGMGGNSELVRDSVEGWLVPPMDAVVLAERLDALSRDPDLCRRMGASGRRRILEEFTPERMLDATLAVYREALSRRTVEG